MKSHKFSITLKHLLKKEWSMGNGQCPECEGVPESWFPSPCYTTPKKIGHKRNCVLAASIKECGGNPLFIGKSKLKGKYKFALRKGENCFGMIPFDEEGRTMGDIISKRCTL